MVIRIDTSGWSYDHWHPELYPPGLPARHRLARYAAAFGTAERVAAGWHELDDKRAVLLAQLGLGGRAGSRR